MRTFEIFLLAANGLLLRLAIFPLRQTRWRNGLPLGAVLILALHLLLEQYRWQTRIFWNGRLLTPN